jgi:hypothetical protein
MAKSDPTKDKEFKRVLGNLLKAPPKPQSEMKLGAKKSAKRPKKRMSESPAALNAMFRLALACHASSQFFDDSQRFWEVADALCSTEGQVFDDVRRIVENFSVGRVNPLQPVKQAVQNCLQG